MTAALGPGARLVVLDQPMGAWRTTVHGADALPIEDGDVAPVRASVIADTLRLDRDPVGHRSLFFASVGPGRWVFASLLSGVLASGLVPRTLAVERVPLYLAFAYVPGRHTLVAGVEAVEAGATVFLGDAAVHEAAPARDRAPSTDPDATQQDTLRALLEQVIREQMPAPGAPAGATLSGGIDSSLVLALLHQLHDGPHRAFSVTFGPPHKDELAWSRLVCDHLGVPQQTVLVRPEDIRDRFDETVGALSQPNGDPLTVPNLLLFEAAAQFAPDLFNGEGGDPCFGGPKNAPMMLADLLDDTPREIAYLRAHQRLFDDLDALWTQDPAVDRMCADLAPWFDGRRPLLDALMEINIVYKGAWHILPKVDHLGARFGVRPRSPLFHPALVAHTFGIPGRLKRAGAVEKFLLKEAVADLLPRSVVDRPKSGMMVPVEAWFAGPLRAWAEERLMDGLGRSPLFRRSVLEDLFHGRRLGLRPRRGIKLWQLLTLEAWARLHRIPLA